MRTSFVPISERPPASSIERVKRKPMMVTIECIFNPTIQCPLFYSEYLSVCPSIVSNRTTEKRFLQQLITSAAAKRSLENVAVVGHAKDTIISRLRRIPSFSVSFLVSSGTSIETVVTQGEPSFMVGFSSSTRIKRVPLYTAWAEMILFLAQLGKLVRRASLGYQMPNNSSPCLPSSLLPLTCLPPCLPYLPCNQKEVDFFFVPKLASRSMIVNDFCMRQQTWRRKSSKVGKFFLLTLSALFSSPLPHSILSYQHIRTSISLGQSAKCSICTCR